MRYLKIKPRDVAACVNMSLKLWPDADKPYMKNLFEKAVTSNKQTCFVARNDEGTAIAFMIVNVRRDYVEGSDAQPVGYIEGIFVESAYRKSGVARALVKRAETWTKQHGFTYLASDTEFHNKASQAFHKQVGFDVAERIVHFIKKV